MPVTEFATLSLRQDYDRPALLQALKQCQKLQDEWMLRNQPCSIEPNVSFSSMYLEQVGPDHTPAPSLLITAPWDSTEAHGEWIQCEDNQACNAKLSKYMAPGRDSVVLFHLQPAGSQAQIRNRFLTRGSFSVCRISVDPDHRDSLQQAYQSVEAGLLDRGIEGEVWAGWKLETSGGVHDFVLFWSDNAHRHVLHLMSFSDKKVHHRFKHVL